MDNEMRKRNRNNRKRGAKFEKTVADFLDMDLVPYSGSNARFGFGDIRDSIWLGECKNITAKDEHILIQKKWIDKNAERAEGAHRKSFIAFMASGSPHKYVLLDSETAGVFMLISNIIITLPKKVHNTVNYNLDISQLPTGNRIMKFDLDGEYIPYYVMTIEHFREIMNNSGLKGTRSGDQL